MKVLTACVTHSDSSHAHVERSSLDIYWLSTRGGARDRPGCGCIGEEGRTREMGGGGRGGGKRENGKAKSCLLYTSDAADES